MKKLVYTSAAVSLILGLITAVLYNTYQSGIYFSLSVTFFTTFYHIAMRLAAGFAANLINIGEKDLYEFTISETETRFYKMIKLRKWKNKVPTYKKDMFSLKKNSYAELCRNMIISQKGHEMMVLLSFVPLLFSKMLDGFVPFLITSVLAAVFDMQFVFIQRFNRARIAEIMRKGA